MEKSFTRASKSSPRKNPSQKTKSLLALILLSAFLVAFSATAKDEFEDSDHVPQEDEGRFREFQEYKRRSYIEAYFGRDSTQSRNFTVGYGHAFENRQMLSLSVGRTLYEEISSQVRTNNLGIGFSSDPFQEWTYRAFYTFFGNKDDLRVHTIGVSARYSTVDWVIGLQPEFRSVDLFLNGNVTRGASAFGLEPSVTYLGLDHFEISLYLKKYFYGTLPSSSQINRLSEFGQISTTAFSELSGVVDFHYGGGMTYLFSDWSLGAEFNHTRAKVTGLHANTFTGVGTFSFVEDWTFTLELGGYFPGTGDSNRFGTLGVRYSW